MSQIRDFAVALFRSFITTMIIRFSLRSRFLKPHLQSGVRYKTDCYQGRSQDFSKGGGGESHCVKHYRHGVFATEYCRLFA